jgi:hypothetical protein
MLECTLEHLLQPLYSEFSMYIIQHCFICRPSDSAVSEDAGIEYMTVATLHGIDSQTH